MSYTITTDVFCDKCTDWTKGETSGKMEKNRALKIAIAKGWKHIKGEHYCPACFELYKSTKKLK